MIVPLKIADISHIKEIAGLFFVRLTVEVRAVRPLLVCSGLLYSKPNLRRKILLLLHGFGYHSKPI